MIQHRFRELFAAEISGSDPFSRPINLSDSFVPCPIAFDPVQQANVEAIYRIAAGRVAESCGDRPSRRLLQFSMN